jgi:short-subunit dehydrogenase
MSKVLVIGATSAIAAEVVRLHAARGDDLFLLGRNEEALRALQGELAPRVVGLLAGDFGDMKENEPRVSRALAALGGVDVILLAHGWLGDQLVSERSFDHAADVIATNFTSAVSFLVPIVNALESRGRGALVVLSSVAGDRGRPRNYTYGSAKGALSLYLQGVRSRLYKTAPAVRVVTVRLGPVDTPMTRDHEKNIFFAERGSVARGILRCEERGPLDVYLPWYWQPIMAAVRTLPERVFQRFQFLAGR